MASPPLTPPTLPGFRQDRLLFGALVGTLSPSNVPLLTKATSSLEAWNILSETYAKPSRGHIKQLQHRLKQTTKTSTQSISDYMHSIKTIVDELSSLGKQMDQEDITDAILTGLDQTSYKTIIDTIHARDNSISFHELHKKLINHEFSLVQSPTAASTLHQPTTAFAANKRPSNRPWQPRPQPYPTVTLPSLPRPPSSTTSPQAHMMHLPTSSSSDWLFDSGVSHHITNDLNALSLHSPYDGTDDLVIGDGSCLTITHVGYLLLPLSTTKFHLTNVLCVPHISRNIISISRL
ncbi:hypothetical protein LXL04_004519 [Taraxacum kok-saghyz]